ncbi:hypothetical protein TNCV_468271 [Trichonephila clavipes]|nr:hypothetical protein TNCV_468271 [Trichonephila clavipes]
MLSHTQNLDLSPIEHIRIIRDVKLDSLRVKLTMRPAMAGSGVIQSGRPIFDDFFQHLWPYMGNNTANVIFQMVKRLWLIRRDQ